MVEEEPLNKNAVMMLNRLHKDLEYKLLVTEGPIHNPRYCMSVDVNGITFIGEGKSKKMAKCLAASKALKSLNHD